MTFGRFAFACMVAISIYLAITGAWWGLASLWMFGGIAAFLLYAAVDFTFDVVTFLRGLFRPTVNVHVERETADDHAAMIANYRERQKHNGGNGDPTRGA